MIRWWCFGRTLLKHWKLRMKLLWSFFILLCEYLNHWFVIAGPLASRWWFFEETLMTLRSFNVLIIRTLMFFAAWMIFRWWSYEESSIRFGDLDANINDNTLFVLISDILMFHYCFLDDSLMMLLGDNIETLINWKEASLVYFVLLC